MKRTIAMLLGAAIGAVLTGCAPTEQKMAEAGHAPMTQEDVTALLGDKTVRGVTGKGVKYVVYYEPGGAMRGQANWSGGSEKDTGTWTVTEDGLYCRIWSKWREAKEACYRLYNTGDGITGVVASGNGEAFKQKPEEYEPGNPAKL